MGSLHGLRLFMVCFGILRADVEIAAFQRFALFIEDDLLIFMLFGLLGFVAFLVGGSLGEVWFGDTQAA